MTRSDRRLAAVCAVAGVVLLFIAASLYLVDETAGSSFSYSLVAGIALLIAYAILDPTAVSGLAGRRRAGSRSRSVAVTAVVLGVLVAVNLIASRGIQAWDLTRGGVNSLASESVLAASRLDADLQVVGLFRPGAGNGQPELEALIGLYQAQSRHVKYRRENYDTDTFDISFYRVKEPNTVVLDYNGRTELLAQGSQLEQDITTAVFKLESLRVPLVCWATGDGGRSLDDVNPTTGYSGVADILSRNNFTTSALAISQVTSIPAGCDEVALVGSSMVLPDASVKALDDYLAGGGQLLIAAEPWQDPAVTRSMSAVLKPYGLGFSGGLVIETDPARAAPADPTVPLVLAYGESPITTDIKGVVSFFPRATAITGTPDPTASVVAIGKTSSGSFAIDSARQDLSRHAGDAGGPFTVMETVEKGVGLHRTRIVIVGTAGFADNRTLPPSSVDGNLDLTLGVFQWLAGQDSLSIAPKPGRVEPLPLRQQDQSTMIFVTAVMMPGLLVLGGVLVWWRRRAS